MAEAVETEAKQEATTADETEKTADEAGTEVDLAEYRPSLYDEIADHFSTSVLTYGMGFIRQLVREGKVSGEKADLLMKTPISALDIMEGVDKNMDALQQNLNPKSFDLWINKLGRNKERIQSDPRLLDRLKNTILVEYADNQDLVYQILLNKKAKEITVAFRGTITKRDVMADADLLHSRLPNPAKNSSRPDLPDNISIHRGFRSYIANKEKQETKQQTAAGELRHKILGLLDENPGFRLYTTGHSLGAAMATLFAFVAAAKDDSRIVKPVSCICFGSPRVGNVEFYESYHALEDEGLLRTLRVKNEGDPVTMVPQSLVIPVLWWKKRPFRHVGIKIVLREDGLVDMSYKRSRRTTITKQAGKVGGRQTGRRLRLAARNPMVYHSNQEYLTRIGLAADDLKHMYWDDLYDSIRNKS